MLLEHLFDAGDKLFKAELLRARVSRVQLLLPQLEKSPALRGTGGRTLSAETMCSGLSVFFESFSQISFASEDTVKRNSMAAFVARQSGGCRVCVARALHSPLQQSTMRSFTSFVAVKPSGNSSGFGMKDQRAVSGMDCLTV